MKLSVLMALGLLGADGKRLRQHQHHTKKQVSNQELQKEIEVLQANFNRLENQYQQLSTSMHNSFAQGPYGIAGPGGPTLPSPQPFVRGEKQWMDNAQNIVDYEDDQTDKANTRTPYHSTAQLNGPAPFGLALGAEGKAVPGAPSLPSPQPFTRGEKQWMDNAQNIGDWGDQQMTVANTRIPYQSVAQAEGPAPNGLATTEKGKPIPGAPSLPAPQPFVRGEKQWMDNAQNIGDWGDQQMTVANTRIPYQSVAQTEGPAPYGLAADKEGKPIPGAPSLPSPQPFTRGEKQWMDNAQNIGDWGDQQMTVANTRIPYQSVAQVEGPYGNAGANGKGPTLPSPQPFVRGEKQWMDNAQNIGDWGDQQMTVANTRIPYQSVAQVEGPYGNAGANGKGPTLPSPQPFVRGEKQWMDNAQNIGDWGDAQMTVANTRIPYQSVVQLEGPYGNAGANGKGPTLPSPQPFVRGEKQWMDNAQNIGDWGDQQMTVANTRIPYQSTFVQTRDEDAEEESEYEKDTDTNILYEKDVSDPASYEKMYTSTEVPISAHLLQTRDDDPSKMEEMLMEDPNIPLNLRLVHIETEEGDELIRIQ